MRKVTLVRAIRGGGCRGGLLAADYANLQPPFVRGALRPILYDAMGYHPSPGRQGGGGNGLGRRPSAARLSANLPHEEASRDRVFPGTASSPYYKVDTGPRYRAGRVEEMPNHSAAGAIVIRESEAQPSISTSDPKRLYFRPGGKSLMPKCRMIGATSRSASRAEGHGRGGGLCGEETESAAVDHPTPRIEDRTCATA